MKNHASMATYLRGTGQYSSHAAHLKSHRRNNFSSVIMRQRDLMDEGNPSAKGSIQEAGRGLVIEDRGTNAGRRFPDTVTRTRRKGELPERRLPKIDQQLNEYTTKDPPPKAPDDIQALAKLAGN